MAGQEGTNGVRLNGLPAFAGEFRKGLRDGLSVEPALVEARKAPVIKNWYCSSCVLHANTGFPLETIRR